MRRAMTRAMRSLAAPAAPAIAWRELHIVIDMLDLNSGHRGACRQHAGPWQRRGPAATDPPAVPVRRGDLRRRRLPGVENGGYDGEDRRLAAGDRQA